MVAREEAARKYNVVIDQTRTKVRLRPIMAHDPCYGSWLNWGQEGVGMVEGGVAFIDTCQSFIDTCQS